MENQQAVKYRVFFQLFLPLKFQVSDYIVNPIKSVRISKGPNTKFIFWGWNNSKNTL